MVYRTRLLTGKLPKPLAISGDRKQLPLTVYSPTSPLELDQQSPKTWKRRDGEGIGLGIVASLEKTCSKNSPKLIFGPVNRHIALPQRLNFCREYQKTELGCSTTTGACSNCDDNGKRAKYGRKMELFSESSPLSSPSMMITAGKELQKFQVADFLSHCHLCRQNLNGKDIYMYRGDKAFCSEECRYKQIVNDEYQEKCGVEAYKSPEISSSPISGQLFFTTGIVVS